MMEEKYSKEFMDAYKERLRRIWSGETFEYPIMFNSNFVASSAIAVVDSFVSEDGFKFTIRREEEK